MASMSSVENRWCDRYRILGTGSVLCLLEWSQGLQTVNGQEQMVFVTNGFGVMSLSVW